VELDLFPVVTREDEEQGFGLVCNARQEFTSKALAFIGEATGLVAMQAWETSSESKKLPSAPESTRASRGRVSWFQHRVAFNCMRGYGTETIWLVSTPTVTGEPCLLAEWLVRPDAVPLAHSKIDPVTPRHPTRRQLLMF